MRPDLSQLTPVPARVVPTDCSRHLELSPRPRTAPTTPAQKMKGKSGTQESREEAYEQQLQRDEEFERQSAPGRAERARQQAENDAALKALRAELLASPALPPDRNPLLARWRVGTGVKPRAGDDMSQLMEMLSNPGAAMCEVVFGGGTTEFKPGSWAANDSAGDDSLGPIQYRAKGKQVFALPDQGLPLLGFDIVDGAPSGSFGCDRTCAPIGSRRHRHADFAPLRSMPPIHCAARIRRRALSVHVVRPVRRMESDCALRRECREFRFDCPRRRTARAEPKRRSRWRVIGPAWVLLPLFADGGVQQTPSAIRRRSGCKHACRHWPRGRCTVTPRLIPRCLSPDAPARCGASHCWSARRPHQSLMLGALHRHSTVQSAVGSMFPDRPPTFMSRCRTGTSIRMRSSVTCRSGDSRDRRRLSS